MYLCCHCQSCCRCQEHCADCNGGLRLHWPQLHELHENCLVLCKQSSVTQMPESIAIIANASNAGSA